MSKPRVLVFAPFSPYPPTTGAHHRVLHVLRALRSLGYTITFASSTLPTESRWTEVGKQYLASELVDAVEIYFPKRTDLRAQQLARKFYRYTRREPSLSNWLNTPPLMRRWFARLIERSRADVIMMNYAYWDALLKHQQFHARWRVVDTLDLVSAFEDLQATLQRALLDPSATREQQAKVVSLEYAQTLEPKPAKNEFDVYDKYSVAIGITKRDTELIAQHAPHTRAHYLPMALTPVALNNQYDASALFALGPNIFNLHGYQLFTQRVLPWVLQRAPSFCLDITGTFFSHLIPEAPQGIQLRGFVPDLDRVYEHARFFVCPTVLGTGQQIKLLDAMAHGLAVVAFRQAVSSSPVVHGESGFIADDTSEFAEYVARLWNDTRLSAQMGQKARATIDTQARSGNFEFELQKILTP